IDGEGGPSNVEQESVAVAVGSSSSSSSSSSNSDLYQSRRSNGIDTSVTNKRSVPDARENGPRPTKAFPELVGDRDHAQLSKPELSPVQGGSVGPAVATGALGHPEQVQLPPCLPTPPAVSPLKKSPGGQALLGDSGFHGPGSEELLRPRDAPHPAEALQGNSSSNGRGIQVAALGTHHQDPAPPPPVALEAADNTSGNIKAPPEPTNSGRSELVNAPESMSVVVGQARASLDAPGRHGAGKVLYHSSTNPLTFTTNMAAVRSGTAVKYGHGAAGRYSPGPPATGTSAASGALGHHVTRGTMTQSTEPLVTTAGASPSKLRTPSLPPFAHISSEASWCSPQGHDSGAPARVPHPCQRGELWGVDGGDGNASRNAPKYAQLHGAVASSTVEPSRAGAMLGAGTGAAAGM
ncbi:unnamed protein product, partial [Discosporangium mesarthrocarpum]